MVEVNDVLKVVAEEINRACAEEGLALTGHDIINAVSQRVRARYRETRKKDVVETDLSRDEAVAEASRLRAALDRANDFIWNGKTKFLNCYEVERKNVGTACMAALGRVSSANPKED